MEMKARRRTLWSKIEEIEARHKALEASQDFNEFNIDTSPLAQAQKTVEELDRKVSVEARKNGFAPSSPTAPPFPPASNPAATSAGKPRRSSPTARRPRPASETHVSRLIMMNPPSRRETRGVMVLSFPWFATDLPSEGWPSDAQTSSWPILPLALCHLREPVHRWMRPCARPLATRPGAPSRCPPS